MLEERAENPVDKKMREDGFIFFSNISLSEPRIGLALELREGLSSGKTSLLRLREIYSEVRTADAYTRDGKPSPSLTGVYVPKSEHDAAIQA